VEDRSEDKQDGLKTLRNGSG